jgi:hypothetical protein
MSFLTSSEAKENVVTLRLEDCWSLALASSFSASGLAVLAGALPAVFDVRLAFDAALGGFGLILDDLVDACAADAVNFVDERVMCLLGSSKSTDSKALRFLGGMLIKYSRCANNELGDREFTRTFMHVIVARDCFNESATSTRPSNTAKFGYFLGEYDV